MKTLLYYHPGYQKYNVEEDKNYTNLRGIVSVINKNHHASISLCSLDIHTSLSPKEKCLTQVLTTYQGPLNELVVIVNLETNTYVDEIKENILTFPEVSFYFLQENYLETLIPNDVQKGDNGTSIISIDNDTYKIVSNLHVCNINKDGLINVYFDSQYYDASNLRNVLRRLKHHSMKLHNNFEPLSKSRNEHLAMIVDEDVSQTEFVAYSLYMCGYRSIIASTGEKLKKIKDNTAISYDLIIRDFDLQFQDLTYPQNGTADIYWVRGCKEKEDLDNKSNFIGWEKESLFTESNPFWRQDEKLKTYYLSYDYPHIIFSAIPKKNNSDILLSLPGMYKPIAGIYQSIFNNIVQEKENEIKNIVQCQYDESHVFDNGLKSTQREGREHDSPLCLYQDAIKMVTRAELYYKNKQYIIASITAHEAVLFLNRFHKALSIRAYSIHALSENALAMSVLGGNERDLANDTKFRVKEIEKMVVFLYDKNEVTTGKHINTLNQIYSDCRLFCKEKEHFESEDVFIKAMAHNNERFSVAVKRLWLLFKEQ